MRDRTGIRRRNLCDCKIAQNSKGELLCGRRTIWKRDENRCRWCSCAVVDDRTVKKFAGEVHHINKDGMDDRMVNKILVCKECHSALHHLSEEDYVKIIEEITGIRTEVITDKKTFKIWRMAEQGASLSELCATAKYSEDTVFAQLSGIFDIEKLQREDSEGDEEQ